MCTNEETNMKATVLITFLLSGAASPLLAQTGVTQPEIAKISASKSTPIPRFLVYRHFLAWVNDLDRKAVATGESDPYKFAEPLRRAQLEPNDLDALRKEAKALDSELTRHDQKIKAVIAEYRKTAQHAVENGLALPAAPAEIHEFQAMRTAILVQHMVSLRAELGTRKSLRLDTYLDREFVPHMSLKPLAKPAASTVSGVPRQPFTIEQH
jgi:hypothetical protein